MRYPTTSLMTPSVLAIAAVWTMACTLVRADDAPGPKWELPGIFADQNQTDPEVDNWVWDRGNPWQKDGATWTVAMQTASEPELTTEFTPMSAGLLYNFVHGWVDGTNDFDPGQFYQKKVLSTKSSNPDSGTFPENSKASAILFKPPKGGTYHVEISGTVDLQMKSAGYASVCIYKMKMDRSGAKLIERQLLNSPDGLDDYPNHLQFDQKVTLDDDEDLVVRIQTISPGQAPGGRSSVAFDKFIVSADSP